MNLAPARLPTKVVSTTRKSRMEGSREQLNSKEEREERLYAELLAAEAVVRDAFAEIDLLLKSRAADTAIEASLPRYEDAQRRFSLALDQWLDNARSVAAE